jgi:putative peptidoglycan lipid II flippase
LTRNWISSTLLRTQTAVQASFLLVLINASIKVFSLIKEMVFANQFGATALTDAFNSALILPNFFGTMIAGALVSAFIPIFIKVHEQDGEQPAWRLTSQVFTILLVIAAGVSLLLLLFAYPVSRLIAPGFSPDQLNEMVRLSRFLLPFIFFSIMLSLFSAIMYSYQHFLLPAVTNLLNPLAGIACIILLTSRLSIASAVVGTVVGIGLQLMLIAGILLQRKPFLRLSFHWRGPDLGMVFRMMLPLLIGGSVSMINMYMDRIIASFLPISSISALNYATKVISIPQSLFIGSVLTAMYPTLALWAARKNMAQFKQSLSRGLSALWFIVIPSIVGLITLGKPVISAVYQHGAFTAENTALTASVLLFYSFGLFAQAGGWLFSNAFVTMQDTVTPVLLGLVAIGLNINLALLLAPHMGANGLALATSIASFVNFLMLFFFLGRRIGFSGFRSLWALLGKTVLASGLMGVCVFFLWQGIELWFNPTGYWIRLFFAGLAVLIGTALFVLFSYLLRISELERYLGFARSAWGKVRSIVRRPRN